MLELTLSYGPSKPARQWLQDNPAQAIAGLIPVAAGCNRLSEAAIAFLHLMNRKGYEAYIRQCLSDQHPDIATKVQKLVLDFSGPLPLDAESTPTWWWQAFDQHATSKKIKSPTWLHPLELPPILLGKHCLNPQQVVDLLIALKQSTLTAPHPVITALKTQAHPSSLDHFAWRLFEIWLSEGALPKENWAMIAVGLLGNDPSVLKLAPLIREMPGEGHHQRAVLGLECLRTIGTDTALMQINAIAQKVKYKGLKQKTEDCIAAIAQARHLSREQLEDRIVPDCGFDQQGTRVFDYGSRQFHVVFGGEMQPMVRDGDGKLKNNLPKPKANDDAALTEPAIAEWKLLKQQIQIVIKTQRDRLERAMLAQRRWQFKEFSSHLVYHPLMTNLAQRLVWGVYDASERFITFRVTEDLTYADVHDQMLAINEDLEVGIVHSAQLSQELRNTWGELFSDYELIQPFRQLSRTIFSLEPEEVESQVIKRFQGIEVQAMILSAILEKTGWHYTIHPNNQLHYHCKAFPFANVTAVMEHPSGIHLGYDSGAVKLNTCFFLSGLYPNIDWQQQNSLVLNHVDPVVVSEVLRNLGAIAAKGE
ncbi:DUF4132 domain-containing protein [Trichocoleus desertorum AS-A10]|uniref:DUF4132 domain-containing protein n=1 Tax=Trichocoleus desertorum TaxID=1481672 RepID=UPI0032970ABD